MYFGKNVKTTLEKLVIALKINQQSLFAKSSQKKNNKMDVFSNVNKEATGENYRLSMNL